MRTISKEEIQENEMKRHIIDEKLKNGTPLSIEEIWMMGEQLELDVVQKYPDCEDMYYRKLYLIHFGESLPGLPQLSQFHIENLFKLIDIWGNHLNDPTPPNKFYSASQKETKRELRELKKEWGKQEIIDNDAFQRDLFNLFSWSKFRFVLIRKVFELDIKDEFYPLSLNGKPIKFDIESAFHILSRHFAHGMKPYESLKDHFYGLFEYGKLHREFENIFKIIDESGVYISDDVSDINFRFLKQIYKIWCVKEKGSNNYRISTFYPVSNEENLTTLSLEYSEYQLNDKLSVFTKKFIHK